MGNTDTRRFAGSGLGHQTQGDAGLTRGPLLCGATLVALIASILLRGYASAGLPVGTAYAVWTGIGSVGTVILGIILFGESASLPRMACISLIAIGILGLKFIAKS